MKYLNPQNTIITLHLIYLMSTNLFGMNIEPKKFTIGQYTKGTVQFEKTSDDFSIVKLPGCKIDSLKDVLELKAQEKNSERQQPITLISNLSLDVSYNPITEFPAFWFTFRNLTGLNLSHCNLQKIGKVFLPLAGLRVLDVSHNSLEELPEIHMNSLETLDISHNNFKVLPKLSTSLRQLFAHHNQIEKIDQQFLFVLASAQLVSLSHNKITQLPSLYKALQERIQQGIPANASRENIDRFRDDFFQLDNTLVQFKQAISRRINQQYIQRGPLILDCYDNNLQELPLDLTLFEFVTKLDCGKNNLTSLPVELATLKMLNYVNVSENPAMQQFIASLNPDHPLAQFLQKLYKTAEEKRVGIQNRIAMYTKLLADKKTQEKQLLAQVTKLDGADDSFIQHSSDYFSGTQQSLSAELEKAEKELEVMKREGFCNDQTPMHARRHSSKGNIFQP